MYIFPYIDSVTDFSQSSLPSFATHTLLFTHLLLKLDEEELDGEGHEVARVEAVPQGEEGQRDALGCLATAQELEALEYVPIQAVRGIYLLLLYD